MSETILKVMLAELGVLRIVCKQCETSVEIAVPNLDRKNPLARRPSDVCCPGCGAVIRAGVVANHPPLNDAFDNLVAAWQSLSNMKDRDCQAATRLSKA